jgi:acetyltransferase
MLLRWCLKNLLKQLKFFYLAPFLKLLYNQSMPLQTLLNPSSIAIVGVSSHEKKVGHLVAKNMIDAGYKGELYFVHPTEKEILGRQVYPNLAAIGKAVDVVVLAIPADKALACLDEVHLIGCHNIVLYAAGFKETGEEGKIREKILIEKAEKYDITLLGPNGIGFLNPKLGVNATFLKDNSPLGNIGFISQSGALGSVLVDYFAAHKNLGFSYFVSLGNKTIIDEADVLAYLGRDKDTKVIGMYVEDVKDGNKFRRILRQVTKIKPVIILKSGSTWEGSQAALSHTGGLVGNDDVYTAVFAQCGAIRAEFFEEFIMLLKIFSFGRQPISKHILVLSNAGGVGVLLSDDLVKKELSLVTVSEETKKQLAKEFNDSKKITVHNPIDLLGDASAFDYKQAINATMHEKQIGAIIILLTTQANTEIKKTASVIG